MSVIWKFGCRFGISIVEIVILELCRGIVYFVCYIVFLKGSRLIYVCEILWVFLFDLIKLIFIWLFFVNEFKVDEEEVLYNYDFIDYDDIVIGILWTIRKGSIKRLLKFVLEDVVD